MSTKYPYCPECWTQRRDWAEVGIHMVLKHGLKLLLRQDKSGQRFPGHITCVCGKQFSGERGLGQHLEALEGMGLLRNHTLTIEALKRL